MKLTEQDLEEYIAMIKARTGKFISRQQALDDANKLLRFFQIVYGPMERSDFQEVDKDKGNEHDTKE